MRKIFAILLILTMTFTLTGCKSSDYKTAVSLMESSENEQALSMFTELGDYKDSKIKACELLIKEGVKQINEYTDYYLPREINSKNYKYYEEALAAFKSLSAEDQALVSNSSDLKGSIYNNYLALKDLAELNSERNYYEKIAKECTLGYEGNTGIIEGAPVLIAMTIVNKRSGYERDGSFSTTQGTHWESFDAGSAAQTLCLAAHEMGLGTVIMGIFDEKLTGQAINVPEGETVSALIALGYPAEEPTAPKRKDLEKILSFR